MRNMKALSLNIQKSWPTLEFFCRHNERQTNSQIDKQTGQKLYAPHILMHGHKTVLYLLAVSSKSVFNN